MILLLGILNEKILRVESDPSLKSYDTLIGNFDENILRVGRPIRRLKSYDTLIGNLNENILRVGRPIRRLKSYDTLNGNLNENIFTRGRFRSVLGEKSYDTVIGNFE